MAGVRIFAMDSFYVPFVKFINFFAGALVATTAANVLLASDAYAFTPPNGWTQVGKYCKDNTSDTDLYKLRKNSDHSIYGIYKIIPSEFSGGSWDGSKDLTLAEANTKMNDKCGVTSY